MMRRLFLFYVLAEIAAVVALVVTVGWAATLLTLLGTFVVGILAWVTLAGRQLTAQLAQLLSGLKEPRSALGDGAMVGLAGILILVPGLLTSVFGLLLLLPPIRSAVRPRLAAIAGRRFSGSMSLITAMKGRPGRDCIDGEVIDERDVHAEPHIEPPALRQHRA